jgi:hypothetical protein
MPGFPAGFLHGPFALSHPCSDLLRKLGEQCSEALARHPNLSTSIVEFGRKCGSLRHPLLGQVNVLPPQVYKPFAIPSVSFRDDLGNQLLSIASRKPAQRGSLAPPIHCVRHHNEF